MSESEEIPVQHEPSMGPFLASFVLVPAVIVLTCLSIVVGIRWLTHSATNAEQLVDTIEHSEGNVRWRAAVQLAGMLADPEQAAIRHDPRLAGRLTDVLRRELESGNIRKQDLMLRMFLCRALGEFVLDVSLPVLVDATSPQHDADVRRSAVEAIAILSDSLGKERVEKEPNLKDSLFSASRDGDSQVRLSAAYALGVLGGPTAEERLLAMLLDENALVRYNAATGLARWGNRAAIDVLVEMLAPDQNVTLDMGASESLSGAQPELVHVNALEAVQQLLKANSEVPRARLRTAINGLNAATNSPAVQAKIGVLNKLLDEESG